VRVWTWEAFAHGAEVVSYFRWRQAPFGQEQMHAGLQTPDRRLDVGGAEAAQVAAELQRLPALGTGRAQVALVLDYESLWLLGVQPQGGDYNGLQLSFECYSALRSLGLDLDIVPPGTYLGGYALVVLPAMALVSDALLRHLQDTAAQVVLYPRAGSKKDPVRIPDSLPPGALRQLINLRVPRVESLRPGVHDTVRLVGQRERHLSARWRETLEIGSGVEVLAHYGDGAAALLRQARTRYLAGWFSPALQRRVLEMAAVDAGLTPVCLPEGLRIRRRGELLFAFNYLDRPQVLDVPQAQWLVGGSTVPAHGVAIARRRSP
jgi:beta-galactosidase